MSSQFAFRFRRRSKKIDFQDGGHGGHLGFLIGTILAISDLQDTAMLPTEFQVNWPFGSGEKSKNRFSDQNDVSYFLSTSHPDASYQDPSPFRRIKRSIFKMAAMAAILDFGSE